jgi:alpha-galactosidase
VRIVVVGGGSRQWGPKLTTDLLTTPSMADAELVLHDIDPESLPPMQQYGDRLVEHLGTGATVLTTVERRAALDGADYVAVCISTGGFRSMTHDIDVPERHGVRQSVGDSVGPGGISRALRNVPVLVGIGRDMEELCPDALLLNLTNPMSALTRAVTRETAIRAVGLCHEVTITGWMIAIACGVRAEDIAMTVTGVNHLPWVTELVIEGEEGFERLRRDLAERESAAFYRDENSLKLALLDEWGALPGAGDRHVAEFFPWVLTEESDWGKAWGIHLTTIADRERDELEYRDELFQVLGGGKRLPTWQSGELLAPVIDSLVTGTRREVPLNLPNTGQAPYLPDDVVVETMCVADGDGLRGRDAVVPPPPCAEWTRRHAAVHELTVEAAVSGDRDLARAAMQLDPLAARVELRDLAAMTDELLAATAEWLPQFGNSGGMS